MQNSISHHRSSNMYINMIRCFAGPRFSGSVLETYQNPWFSGPSLIKMHLKLSVQIQVYAQKIEINFRIFQNGTGVGSTIVARQQQQLQSSSTSPPSHSPSTTTSSTSGGGFSSSGGGGGTSYHSGQGQNSNQQHTVSSIYHHRPSTFHPPTAAEQKVTLLCDIIAWYGSTVIKQWWYTHLI